ncbi:MAG TPA: imidazole glycerol phosphate synthase subunit HisH [Candidatus Acidoferrum sp.]|jgi:imidazole glycerol phosphate synthase glutamine amidotransferase subunit|nr:imidazole glycerol phosphate synthase subunit HisH [Candidatus Acidoferrum sp.]
MKVTIIDYGAGNVPSVERALQRLGAESQRTASPDCISKADALLLPGVGHYAALARSLDERKMRAPLIAAINGGIPFLGICLGLQVLYEGSEEAEQLHGLHLLPGRVGALPSNVKLPHMGWNQVVTRHDSRLLAGISPGAYFYFAHSYAALDSSDAAAATCSYGAEFAAVIEQKNIFAVQFHPEKSGGPGARVLENFLRLAA